MVRRTLLVLLLLAAAGGAAFAVYESRTSAFEARFFADLTKKLTYRVGKGPSDAIRFPQASPYDERLGYSNLPNYLAKLKTRDYVVVEQARMSPKMVELADHGRQVLLCESPPEVGGAVADRTIGDFFVDEFGQESSWLRAPRPPHQIGRAHV